VVALTSAAWSASPRLTTILPRGAQRGQEHVLTFVGTHLKDAQEIFFYDDGLEITKLAVEGANRLQATVRIAADCRLGEHVAQVRTASGISDYRPFYVGALADVSEREPNSDPTTPQPVALNVTVRGIINNEDVDYFAVDAKQGQRLCAEVEGIRLGDTLFDPYLAIMDQQEFVVAAADDTPLVHQDAIAALVVPRDGRYLVMLRDSAYGGSDQCHYRLHIGTFPQPTAVYPAGGQFNTSISIRFLGDVTGAWDETISLPTGPQRSFGLFARSADGISPTPVPFRLSPLENVLEREPNNRPAEATPAVLPLACNGVISTPGDFDLFGFDASKGQTFDVECYARRLRSPLDPVMQLLGARGKVLSSNDDSRGPDSYLRFQVPADGRYCVRISDQLRRGGDDFVYRVDLQGVRPALTLGIPRTQRNSQYRQTIVVARGNRFGTLISASRTNFGGEVVLDSALLPPGVTLEADPMPANLNAMPVVFHAAADAPVGGQLVDLTAHRGGPGPPLRGHFENRADLVIAAPNQSVYRQCNVDRLAVAVAEALPFTLELVAPQVPLVRNGSMQLRVVAHRQADFTAPIQVQLPFRPPGVGATSSVTIAKDQSETRYPINANGSAQLRKWKIFAIGSAEVGGKAWASSSLVGLEVVDPYVTLTAQRAACQQGETVQIYCKVEHHKPLQGTAQVKLVGLPPKATAADLELTDETKELAFDVKTDKASPAGKYKNVFCQVTITQPGGQIVSRAVSTELQIDKPLPAATATAAPPAAAKPKPTAKPTTRPLSRLQKLRIKAKRQATAGSEGAKVRMEPEL
jgi:hypothetical protein